MAPRPRVMPNTASTAFNLIGISQPDAQLRVRWFVEAQRSVQRFAIRCGVQLDNGDLLLSEPRQDALHHLTRQPLPAELGLGRDPLDVADAAAGVAGTGQSLVDDTGSGRYELARPVAVDDASSHIAAPQPTSCHLPPRLLPL